MSLREGSAWVLGIVLASQLAVVASLDVFPSMDGPIHLHNAAAWSEYERPERAVYREYYTRNGRPSPNWLTQLELAALLHVASPVQAEKVVVFGYLVGLPLALAFALRGLRRRAAWLALLVLPIQLNPLLHTGLFNYCYGLSLWLVAIGLWVRLPEEPRRRDWMAFAGVALLLYFTHIVGTMLLVGSIAGLSIGRAAATEGRSPEEKFRAILQRAVPSALAMTPVILLCLLFFFRKREFAPAGHPGVYMRLGELVRLEHLVSFSGFELATAGAVVAALAFLGFRGVPAASERLRGYASGFDWILLGLLAVYFLTPLEVAGGSQIAVRIPIVLVLTAILRLGTSVFSPRVSSLLPWGIGATALVQLAILVPHYRAQVAELAEFSSCSSEVEKGSTLYAMHQNRLEFEANDGFTRYALVPTIHASARMALERESVTLSNFSAYKGHHPVVYRQHLRPQSTLACADCFPKNLNVAKHEKLGGHVDYLFVWGKRHNWSEARQKLFDAAVDTYFSEVCLTQPAGTGRLFARRSNSNTGGVVPLGGGP